MISFHLRSLEGFFFKIAPISAITMGDPLQYSITDSASAGSSLGFQLSHWDSSCIPVRVRNLYVHVHVAVPNKRYRYNWRVGASQPSRTTGTIFLYIICIYKSMSVCLTYRNFSKCFYVNLNLRTNTNRMHRVPIIVYTCALRCFLALAASAGTQQVSSKVTLYGSKCKLNSVIL